MSEDSKVTVTLKAGQGFEAPWIVIHADNADDALEQINSGSFATLAERTVAAADFFRAAHNVKTGLGKESVQQQPAQQAGPAWSQQGSQQAPAQGGAKQCIHGDMVFRSGTSGKGPWKGYFCPLPKERKQEQCQPEFVR